MSKKKLLLIIPLVLVLAVACFVVGRRAGVFSTPSATPVPTVTPEATVEPVVLVPPTVELSEVMPGNKCFLPDEDGQFSDWIELTNTGTEPADLSGYWLSDKSGSPQGWQISQLVIAPGENALIFCSGKDKSSGELHASFSLSGDGESICLSYPTGELVWSVDFPACGDDQSVCFDSGASRLTYFATPGYPNTDEGYEEYLSSSDKHGSLVINEVAPYNSSYAYQNGEYYDWIELKNCSSAELNLSDYYLADKLDKVTEYRLPDVTLSPGQTYIVFCSGDQTLTNLTYQHAPFALSSAGETVYIYGVDGTLCDHVYVHDAPLDGSMGRIDGKPGFFYFDFATPGEENSGGYRGIAASPVASIASGVYNDVTSLSVELSGEGTIYYSTDGSVPTVSSPEYTGAITFDKTSVLRAVSVVDGKMNSDCATFSYIVNEGHELPVVSLVMEPDDFNGGTGIYTHPTSDWERLGHVSFFEEDSSFDIDCGVKLHGATSRVAQNKKSFKLCFRSRYSGELDYDVFDNGISIFSSILVRAAQEDYYSTQIRDNLMHQLAIQCCPSLPSQDYKYCVLYINGQYWGLYNLREAHSPMHLAQHYGYDVDTVSQWKQAWPSGSAADDLYKFIVSNDMSNSENYQYVCEHLNIESVVGWSIIQAYSGNIDCTCDNMRFYYSTTDGVLHFALVDLDLGMFAYDAFDVPFKSGYAFSNIPTSLMQNSTFRQLFLTRMSEYFTGPLSTDNVLAEIDALAAEMDSEVPRDRERWGGSYEKWQSMVEELRFYVTSYGGRATNVCNAISYSVTISDAERQQYFGAVK